MRPSVLLPLALLLASCGGSEWKAEDPDWSPEPEENVGRGRRVASMGKPTLAPSSFYGVRHDLMLSSTPHPARCSCLAVEVGSPRDPQFFWTGSPPSPSSDALAIAIGARGVPCPGGPPDDRRRPSISAVDQHNDDVIVEVEDLPETRPLASGAIIPKPSGAGSIYIRPREGRSPYGHGPGNALCKVR